MAVLLTETQKSRGASMRQKTRSPLGVAAVRDAATYVTGAPEVESGVAESPAHLDIRKEVKDVGL